MESGEKELRKAFEETTRRNVLSAVQHSNDTRLLVRALEEKVTALTNLVLSRSRDIDLLKQQLSIVQTKLYSKGTSDGDIN